MRNSYLFAGAAAIALLGASGAFADQARIDHPGNAWRDPNFGGGAFRATEISGFIGDLGGPGGTANSFLTFCLEETEFVHLGGTYYTTIGTAAVNGGAGGPSPDPISAVTAAMYREFRNGGNFGGLGQVDTAAETRSLQNAIWFEEQEISFATYSGDALAVSLRNWAIANNDGGLHGVRVLNLWTNSNNTGNAQDMLTIIPLPQAAWAGISSLAGLAGLGYIRRRSQQR